MKIIKISKISKFWNCSSIRYSAPFAILPILISPFDINFISYYSDFRKFGRSKFSRSLIFKFRNISHSKILLFEILTLTHLLLRLYYLLQLPISREIIELIKFTKSKYQIYKLKNLFIVSKFLSAKLAIKIFIISEIF